MNIFQKYAQYYDLLYKNKNYKAECDFLEKIFKKYSKEPIYSILDLGCGTGGHALVLAKRGYRVVGVDASPEMIRIAKIKSKKQIRINFKQGDIRKLKLKKKFDAAISMFAVMSYQSNEKDIISAFRTANKHLNQEGIFIFDCWHGPAVLKQRPEKRVKIFQQKDEKIIRIATPFLNTKKQIVKVEYELIRVLKEKVLKSFKEIHTMRYFFPAEIKKYLRETGFKLIKICPFMKLNESPTDKNWNVTVIAKKYA